MELSGSHESLDMILHTDVRDLHIWGSALVGAGSSMVTIDQIAQAMSIQMVDFVEDMQRQAKPYMANYLNTEPTTLPLIFSICIVVVNMTIRVLN